ncbi:hypothetical protein Agub_g4444 [Astrephomene gubernaculifera]|uniref:Major facilitator superfamily (MFS) profile domain-containing protein n=1 Tax=Astrephomene gubernaculifera TaxID=47775 RepID=A0AAD3HJR8_9CHLO|nr:hypothetical protein Agub_g4444 [Astrephomene gubernaculifera]
MVEEAESEALTRSTALPVLAAESTSDCTIHVVSSAGGQDAAAEAKQLEGLPLLQQEPTEPSVALCIEASSASDVDDRDPPKHVVHKTVKFSDVVEYLGPEEDGSEDSDDDDHLRRVIVSSIIGNTLEWYDFLIYTFLGGVLTKLFFPHDNVYTQMLAFYGVFAAGFATRPLGALLFGLLSDRVSRRAALAASMGLMALPTALVGCLPTYQQVGVAAPVLLVLLRALQGLAVGGEFSATLVFLVEHAPPHARGLAGSWAFASVMIGVLVGSGVATGFSLALSETALLAWGWRVPFLLSLLGSGVGLYIRRRLRDPVAEEADEPHHPHPHHYTQQLTGQENGRSSSSSSSGISANSSTSNINSSSTSSSTSGSRRGSFRRMASGIAQVILLDFMNAAGFYLLVIFLPLYMQTFVLLPHATALAVHTSNMLLYLGLIPLGGWLSDKYGRTRVLLLPALCMAVGSYPLWCLFRLQRHAAAAWAAQAGLTVPMALFTGALPATLVALFTAECRCTGLSIGHNISMAAFGGTAPLAATALLRGTRDVASPAALLVVGAALSAGGALLLRRWKIR